MEIIDKIHIDLNQLKLLKLSVNKILTLIKIYFIANKLYFDYELDSSDIEYLKENKYIIVYENKNIKCYLREKGKSVLEKVVSFKGIETNKVETIQEDKIDNFEEKITKFRLKFNDLRVGAMGSKKNVRLKLKRWMKDNPDVTFKEILEATDAYIESLNGRYQFLQQADYFIYKQNQHKEETSRLSIFIEEGKKDPVNSDWGSEIV